MNRILNLSAGMLLLASGVPSGATEPIAAKPSAPKPPYIQLPAPPAVWEVQIALAGTDPKASPELQGEPPFMPKKVRVSRQSPVSSARIEWHDGKVTEEFTTKDLRVFDYPKTESIIIEAVEPTDPELVEIRASDLSVGAWIMPAHYVETEMKGEIPYWLFEDPESGRSARINGKTRFPEEVRWGPWIYRFSPVQKKTESFKLPPAMAEAVRKRDDSLRSLVREIK